MDIGNNNRDMWSYMEEEALRPPNDRAPEQDILKWLTDNGVGFTTPSAHQIKAGSINYYPSSGKITIDRDTGASHYRGFTEFRMLVLEQKVRLSAKAIAKR